MLKNLFARVGVVALVSAPLVSHAQSSGTGVQIDYSTLLAGVDYTTTIAAIMAVAALLASLYVAIKGAKTFLSFVRGG